MGFDLEALRAAVARHGQVARVVVAQVAGSAPREVGAAMLVWRGGQSGTIGGGTLEHMAAQAAFDRHGLTRHALGPELGQCCGGAVTLLTEQYTAADLETMEGRDVIARGPGEMPLAVHRMLACARSQGLGVRPRLVQGWFVEPLARPSQALWIWGAGHVGRALVDVLSPLPDLAITWVDTAPSRFPDDVPPAVTQTVATAPALLAAHAPVTARHLILTYSHDLDLGLCHALLTRGFDWAGLIGSKTKWARFRSKLRALGHSDTRIDTICCPIGDPALGKHPQAIAIGVAGHILSLQTTRTAEHWPTRFLISQG